MFGSVADYAEFSGYHLILDLSSKDADVNDLEYAKYDDFFSKSSAVLTAMANASRIAILTILSGEGEVSVGALSQQIGLSQSALSQHLAKLRALGLVKTRRDAQNVYYSTQSEVVKRILATLDEFFNHQTPQRLREIS